MKAKTYSIAGKKYEQGPLGIIPAAQLAKLLQSHPVAISGDMTPIDLLAALAPLLPEALAIVLTEVGTHPQDKDIAELAAVFAYQVPPDVALEVVADFFDSTPLHLMAARMAGIIDRIEKGMTADVRSKTRKPSSAS